MEKECQEDVSNEHEEPIYENVIAARHPRTKLREWVEGEAIESFERKALKTVPWVKIAKSI